MPSFAATTGGSSTAAAPGRSVGAVIARRALVRHAADARLRPSAAALRARLRDLRRRSTPRRNNAVLDLPRAQRVAPRRRATYADEPDNVGWWDNMVGPGKPLDTDRFFVVGVNNLGSCFGSTGPLVDQSRRPASRGAPTSRSSPSRTGSTRRRGSPTCSASSDWAAVMGGSLGGMQALCLGHALPEPHPQRAGDRGGAQPVGREHRVQRGRAPGDPAPTRTSTTATSPRRGHEAAARAARRPDDRPHHLPVRRADGGEVRPRSCATASTSASRPSSRSRSYLRHQGEKFADYYDANTYLRITKALDYFDPALATGGDLARALAAGGVPLPRRLVHDRLALRAGALARDRRRRWSTTVTTSRTPRSSRRTATTRSCSTTEQYHAVVRAYLRAHRARLQRTTRRSASARRSRRRSRSARTVGAQRSADFATIAALDRRRRARARPGLRRRQPARVPRARARTRAATASRSTRRACSRRSRPAST